MCEKSRSKRGTKCKAPARETTPYSRPWMAALVEDALTTGELLAACKRAKTPLTEVMRFRRSDPAFDTALAEVDQLARLQAGLAVQALAAQGNLKAVHALTNGTLSTLVPEMTPGPAAKDEIHYLAWETCPHCQYQVFALVRGRSANLQVIFLRPEETTQDLVVGEETPRKLLRYLETLERGEPWARAVTEAGQEAQHQAHRNAAVRAVEARREAAWNAFHEQAQKKGGEHDFTKFHATFFAKYDAEHPATSEDGHGPTS